jgi:hypothetical protein
LKFLEGKKPEINYFCYKIFGTAFDITAANKVIVHCQYKKKSSEIQLTKLMRVLSSFEL